MIQIVHSHPDALLFRSRSIRDFFSESSRRRKLLGCRPGTLATYDNAIGHVERFYRYLSAESAVVTPEQLTSDFLADLAAYMLEVRESSPATVNKVMRHLRAILRHAVARKVIDELPEIPALRESLSNPVAYWPAEIDAILDAAHEVPGWVGPIRARDWWPALIWQVYYSGARITATMHSKVRDINWAGSKVRVRHETQKQRKDQIFKLPDFAMDAIRRVVRPEFDEIYGAWPYDRTAVQWPSLNYHFSKILKAAGVTCEKGDIWHQLRRSHATHLTAAGGDAQRSLGHSDHRVTAKYIDENQLDSLQEQTCNLLPKLGQRKAKKASATGQ